MTEGSNEMCDLRVLTRRGIVPISTNISVYAGSWKLHMVTAFSHQNGSGFVAPLPLGKGLGNVLIIAASIKENDYRWAELKAAAEKFADDNGINRDHIQMVQSS